MIPRNPCPLRRVTFQVLTGIGLIFSACAAPISGAAQSPDNPRPSEAGPSNTVVAADYDLVVYGGTSAGVAAAVQAARMGKKTVIVCPDQHLGGLSSGGLGWTDTGNKAVIGGIAREFYHRIWRHYQDPAAWTWQARNEYGNRGQGTSAIDGARRTMWIFEPHAAEKVFEDLVREHGIPVHRDEWLDRAGGVSMANGRVESIAMVGGRRYRAKMFIDATYEGDLMAAAGIDFHVGREANSVYGERWNGIQKDAKHHGHYFKKPVDPYRTPGDPASGLLPGISAEPPGENGDGDDRIQAYCFRMCLTRVPENRVPFPRPRGYDPDRYELLLRVLDTGWREVFNKFDPIPNLKTDTNNHGPFSTDNIGMNYDYPEASHSRRREIIREHETYQMGLMHFLANDPRVPEDVRSRMAEWGLARDEFTDNGHWPHQIYVREARRMIGAYVMTEHDCLAERETPDPVGMGSYVMDSHNVQRYVTEAGTVQNEGDIGVRPRGPYTIAYGALVPRREQCANILVPVCLSSSHIAFGSIRMEPVFMILGQSAATAAVMAIDRSIAVQDLPYPELRVRLLEDGQVLEAPPDATRARAGSGPSAIDRRTLEGTVIDDDDTDPREGMGVEKQGDWKVSRAIGGFVGHGYLHDDNADKGGRSVRFTTVLPDPGRYEVRIAYTANANRARNVPVRVRAGKFDMIRLIDQTKQPPIDGAWISIGTIRAAANQAVSVGVSNQNTTGHVIADAVQFLKLDP